jgi:hypothetical protein
MARGVWPGSVPATGFDLTQAGQHVEALQQGLGQGRELRAAAQAVDVTEHALAGPTDFVGAMRFEATVELELVEVPEELFAIEVRQGAPSARVQAASENVDDFGRT